MDALEQDACHWRWAEDGWIATRPWMEVLLLWMHKSCGLLKCEATNAPETNATSPVPSFGIWSAIKWEVSIQHAHNLCPVKIEPLLRIPASYR